MGTPTRDEQTLAACFQPVHRETWEDPIVGPLLRHLAEDAPELLEAVGRVDRSVIHDALARTPEARLAKRSTWRRSMDGRARLWSVRLDEPSKRALVELLDAEIELILVGGMAAVLHAAPVVTVDVDIVHRRTPENVDRLLAVLRSAGATYPRGLPPTREALLGLEYRNVGVYAAKLSVMGQIDPHDGYEELIADTCAVPFHGRTLRVLSLPRLIQAKVAAGRRKDRMALPILIATLEAGREPR